MRAPARFVAPDSACCKSLWFAMTIAAANAVARGANLRLRTHIGDHRATLLRRAAIAAQSRVNARPYQCVSLARVGNIEIAMVQAGSPPLHAEPAPSRIAAEPAIATAPTSFSALSSPGAVPARAREPFAPRPAGLARGVPRPAGQIVVNPRVARRSMPGPSVRTQPSTSRCPHRHEILLGDISLCRLTGTARPLDVVLHNRRVAAADLVASSGCTEASWRSVSPRPAHGVPLNCRANSGRASLGETDHRRFRGGVGDHPGCTRHPAIERS